MLHAFKIECLSNLHNGSGDESFGVIDNLIQRDAADGLPVINGSSLKGALREYFEFYNPTIVKHIFGAEPGSQVSEASGNYIFHPAHLLALPVRTNRTPYVIATSNHSISHFERIASKNNLDLPDWLSEIKSHSASVGQPKAFGVTTSGEFYLEDYELRGQPQTTNLPNLEVFLNEKKLAIFSDIDFQTICDDLHLPVRARNQLDHGKSKNLWYEQFVPRMAVFIAFVTAAGDDSNWDTFQKELLARPVQIGGNKSVGDGQCAFSIIPLKTR
jgi:CRISPR-associated protein Cmr4